METIYVLLIVLLLLLFALMFVCINKEKYLSGFYSQLGVCGRWHALIAAHSLVTAALSTVAIPVLLVTNLTGITNMPNVLFISFIIAAALCWLIGIPLYKKAYNRCPDNLKRRLFWDMFVIMLGFYLRLSLFFMIFLFAYWFESNKPTAYEVDGRIVYAYPGSDDLYDDSGCRVGKANSDRTKAIME